MERVLNEFDLERYENFGSLNTLSSKILESKTPSNVQIFIHDCKNNKRSEVTTTSTIDGAKAALVAHNFECNEAKIIVKIKIIGRITLTSPLLRTVRSFREHADLLYALPFNVITSVLIMLVPRARDMIKLPVKQQTSNPIFKLPTPSYKRHGYSAHVKCYLAFGSQSHTDRKCRPSSLYNKQAFGCVSHHSFYTWPYLDGRLTNQWSHQNVE
uniref:Uncharacterized protein n=1 Tax=Glossina pallidipes TaxID=7398 RepID=A0A1B0AJ80_GLOPL